MIKTKHQLYGMGFALVLGLAAAGAAQAARAVAAQEPV